MARPRTTTVRRQEERVLPLELFFDLVFVLAITQATALMAAEHDWAGLGHGLLVLGALWWSWVGYAWLTSVVDPEAGGVRLAIFAAAAAFLVMSLAIPEAFGELGLTFGIAYGVVRFAQVGLFLLASADDPTLRRSILTGLLGSTVVGVTLIVVASQVDGWARPALWVAAILLDIAGPLFFGSEGWELVPGHFAERHGLVVLIALGESVVSIGVGAEGTGLDAGTITAAVVGMGLLASLWWAYFDVITYIAADNLATATPGREQNELARDGYSFLHFPLVAGIVLVAYGLKSTLAHVDEPLGAVAGVALLGGVAAYLVGHVAFAYHDHDALKVHRLAATASSIALLAVRPEVDALVLAALVTAVVAAVVAFESVRYRDDRTRIRDRAREGRAAVG